MPLLEQRSCPGASPRHKIRSSRRLGRNDRRWFGRSLLRVKSYVVRPWSSPPRQESSRSMRRRCPSDACSSCSGKRKHDPARQRTLHEVDRNYILPAMPSLVAPACRYRSTAGGSTGRYHSSQRKKAVLHQMTAFGSTQNLPVSKPPTTGHERGQCSIPKASRRLSPAAGKFPTFSNRPRCGRCRQVSILPKSADRHALVQE